MRIRAAGVDIALRNESPLKLLAAKSCVSTPLLNTFKGSTTYHLGELGITAPTTVVELRRKEERRCKRAGRSSLGEEEVFVDELS